MTHLDGTAKVISNFLAVYRTYLLSSYITVLQTALQLIAFQSLFNPFSIMHELPYHLKPSSYGLAYGLLDISIEPGKPNIPRYLIAIKLICECINMKSEFPFAGWYDVCIVHGASSYAFRFRRNHQASPFMATMEKPMPPPPTLELILFRSGQRGKRARGKAICPFRLICFKLSRASASLHPVVNILKDGLPL